MEGFQVLGAFFFGGKVGVRVVIFLAVFFARSLTVFSSSLPMLPQVQNLVDALAQLPETEQARLAERFMALLNESSAQSALSLDGLEARAKENVRAGRVVSLDALYAEVEARTKPSNRLL